VECKCTGYRPLPPAERPPPPFIDQEEVAYSCAYMALGIVSRYSHVVLVI
jgi:hypothetical protein